MEHKTKKLPGSQIELEVSIDDKEFKEYWQPAYDDAISKVEIKGFRRGQAPKELVACAIDPDKVFNTAVNEAVRFTLDTLKVKNNWTLVDQPKIEVVDTQDLSAQAGGITYKTVLTLFPEVEIANYKKIAKKVFGDRKVQEVGDEEVEKTIKWVRDSRAIIKLVDRPAKIGDLVELDLDAFVEGKPIPNTSFKGERFILGESHFIKGFDESMENHKAGEQFEFSIIAPKDYWQKDLQNKKLEFKVNLKGVYERELPNFDDAFAAGLSSKFKTVDDLKKSIKEGLLLEKDEKETERLRLKILDEIIKDSKMDLPKIFIERTLDGLVTDMKKMLPPDATKAESALDKELREKLTDRAKQNVASHLVLYKIAQTENLLPTKEEVEVAATNESVDLDTHYDYIYGKLQNQKVFAFMDSLKEEAKK